MTVQGIDLFTTAQVVVAATLVVHFCLLRPWNARADLLLTVEMIDKDLTGEIDRGTLPLAAPLVADLQRCLSLSRKRPDASESIANLTGLWSEPSPSGNRPDLWLGSRSELDQAIRPSRLDRIDRLDQLTPAEQHLLLEYAAELSAATAAYLRHTRISGLGWLIRSSRTTRQERQAGAASPMTVLPAATPTPTGRRPPLGSSRDSVRHGRRPRGGWPRPRHPRNPAALPAEAWPADPGKRAEPRRILDLSTDPALDPAYDGRYDPRQDDDQLYDNQLYDNRAHDRLSLDRASLDRLSHNRLMYDNGPFEGPA